MPSIDSVVGHRRDRQSRSVVDQEAERRKGDDPKLDTP
jgi:hypothetical protein